MTPEEVRTYWTDKVMRGMPPTEEVWGHCRAIAAKYAMFYEEHPDIYPWAGVAAFAVHRIGLALALYDFGIFEGDVKLKDHHNDPRGAKTTEDDLNHLRHTNNEFFKDVGW